MLTVGLYGIPNLCHDNHTAHDYAITIMRNGIAQSASNWNN